MLPFERGQEEAARLPEPAGLTVTCSPRHGADQAVGVASRLAGLGHTVTAHISARTVRDADHLDRLLAAVADAGIDDTFVIGGDGDPVGEFDSSLQLLELVEQHPRQPRAIGIAGYPEGHPLINADELDAALERKSRIATYITTQMCFDPGAVRRWISQIREEGIELPVLLGLPGRVKRRRLIEVSARIGVGPSLSFLRKQRGIVQLLRRRSSADTLFDALAPIVDDPELNVAGFHYFTLDQLLDTWTWEREKSSSLRTSPNERTRPAWSRQPRT